jgi:hypothetical protein
MLAEIFTSGGYHAGRDLIPASSSNPHGFFEDIRVNRRNDELLASLRLARPGRRLARDLWWMEALEGPVGHTDGTIGADLVPPTPFVMKDPRFVYTGPAWAATWGAPLVIVVVRPVAEVTRSLVAMANREPALFSSMPPSTGAFRRHVAAMWRSMYGSVLDWADDDAVFVTEEGVRTGRVVAGLGRLSGAALTIDTVDRSLHRHALDDARHHRSDVVDPVTERVMGRVRRDAARLRRVTRLPVAVRG